MSKDQPETGPQMVAIGSPEFNAVIANAVRLALAGQVAAAPARPGGAEPVVIQHTSIDRTKPGRDDLTVRFRRFCVFQNSGYQRGQEAGFPRAAAEDLRDAGAAFIVHDPRDHDTVGSAFGDRFAA